MRHAVAFAFALALVLLAAQPARADRLVVFAASSLKESLDAAARAFEAASGHRVAVSYGPSNTLARQVESGAPAHVFISADAGWIDHVQARGLVVEGSRRDILGNELVLIAAAGSNATLVPGPRADLAGLLGGKRLALANPASVPAGRYARAALASMGLWDSVAGKVVAAESVRAALAWVARGEAPLGIVYRTDALAETKVRIVATFPAGSHPRIVYPLVVLKRSATPAAATFAAWLASPEAQAIFARHGFLAP